MMRMMYISNNEEVAKLAEKAGVDRIWVDLEILHKEERQYEMNTVISRHKVEDVYNIRKVIHKSDLLVRVNPINEGSKEEIEQVIDYGADIIMLPMFKGPREVETFLDLIQKRTRNILLLETKEAVEQLDEILKIPGIDEVHIGLNDLHLSYNESFLFEPLANGLVDQIATKLQKKKIPFGFGGIAQIRKGLLPAELILGEHYRLGSQAVILSRSFCNVQNTDNLEEVEDVFINGIKRIRQMESYLQTVSEDYFIENRKLVIEKVNLIVDTIMGKKQ